jgi:Mn2+/Fe2+ NRAMP family transporter
MPNLIPDWLPWMRPAGRLLWAVGLLVIGLIIVAVLMRRPKPDRPATWAECMAGAVGVFALMALAYAIIPHEWITFSDKYLQWSTTKFLVHSGQDILFFKFPFDINYKAISDVVTVVIYTVMVSLNVYLFSAWQKRGQEKEAPVEEAPKKSRFGRPLRRPSAAPEPATAGVGASTNGGDA